VAGSEGGGVWGVRVEGDRKKNGGGVKVGDWRNWRGVGGEIARVLGGCGV